MNMCIDIYTLSKQRTLHNIEKFLNLFCDRKAIEHREDEELSLIPLGTNEKSILSENYDAEWLKAKTVTNSIRIGLQNPHRAFAIYYPSNKKYISQVILSFTYDGYIILGLSVEESIISNPLKNAIRLLKYIKSHFFGISGFIIYEEPPPRSKAGFDLLLNSKVVNYVS